MHLVKPLDVNGLQTLFQMDLPFYCLTQFMNAAWKDLAPFFAVPFFSESGLTITGTSSMSKRPLKKHIKPQQIPKWQANDS